MDVNGDAPARVDEKDELRKLFPSAAAFGTWVAAQRKPKDHSVGPPLRQADLGKWLKPPLTQPQVSYLESGELGALWQDYVVQCIRRFGADEFVEKKLSEVNVLAHRISFGSPANAPLCGEIERHLDAGRVKHPELQAAAWGAVIRYHTVSGRIRHASMLLGKAPAAADLAPKNPWALAALSREEVAVRCFGGDRGGAAKLAAEALDRLEALVPPGPDARAQAERHSLDGICLLRAYRAVCLTAEGGTAEEADRCMDAALDRAKIIGHPYTASMVLLLRAWLFQVRGERAECAEACERTIEESGALQLPRAIAEGLRAWAGPAPRCGALRRHQLQTKLAGSDIHRPFWCVLLGDAAREDGEDLTAEDLSSVRDAIDQCRSNGLLLWLPALEVLAPEM